MLIRSESRGKALAAEKARTLIKQFYEELAMSAPSLTQNQRAVKALEMARQKAQMEDETTARDLEMVKAPPESRPGTRTYVYATVIGLSCRYGIGRRKFSSSDVCFSLFELF